MIEKEHKRGTNSYHPKMLLKVLVCAYTEQIYSMSGNISFMWRSVGNWQDFRIIA